MARTIPIDAELETGYDVRMLRDDFAQISADWVARSASTRSNADVSLDCAYGAGEKDRLDIFRSGARNAPLYVFIHGGYWQRGDKSVYSFITEPFMNAGIDVAMIGYQLCPDATMSAINAKIAEAVAWLYRNADGLQISADRINLSGHSAGGHLTAMGLTQQWSELGADLPVDLLKTGIPFSGLYQLEPLLQTTISDALHLSDDEVSSLSPQFLLPASDAPVLVILGGAETPQFHWQSDRFIEQWLKHEVEIDKHVEPDVDHFDLLNRLADPGSEIFQRIRQWVK